MTSIWRRSGAGGGGGLELCNAWRGGYRKRLVSQPVYLTVIYHPLYSMNNFVTNKSKLPQDGAQVFPFMG